MFLHCNYFHVWLVPLFYDTKWSENDSGWSVRTFSSLDFLFVVQIVVDSSLSSRLPEQVQRFSVEDRDFTLSWGDCYEVIYVSFPFFVYIIQVS